MSSSAFRAPIRSYVRRQWRLTRSQEDALVELWPKYGIDFDKTPLCLADYFPQEQDCVIEIGFGMGQALSAAAIAQPDVNFLGIEVHRPGVGSVIYQAAEAGSTNLRIIMHDAVEVLRDGIPDNSLAGVRIFFPDPWHKTRHHKRRLIQTEFVALLCQKLKPQAYVHLATDWENYAKQMMRVLSAETRLKNRYGEQTFAPQGLRASTKFEARGLRLGHGVWDLVFEKLA